jgi:hypothetical protein
VPRFVRSASAIVFASLLAFGMAGCGSPYQEKVVGAWEWKFGEATVLVTINADGTGSLKGPAGEKKLTWRIQRGNNFVMNDGQKDSGFLIDSVEDTTLQGTDPKYPGVKIVWTRKK